jgi:hypothetical protein
VKLRLTAVALAVLLAGSPAPGLAQTKAPADKAGAKGKGKGPVPGYKKMTIQGFTVLVNKSVEENNDDPAWKRKPLEVLDLELTTIVRRLPTRYVAGLRKILLWVEWEDRDDPDLKLGVVAKYYGVYGNLAEWSLSKGKHPLKANNVEVINMKSLTREHQPGVKFERCVLLHELVHAVHHQALGSHNPQVKVVYQLAMKRKLYATSKDVYGRTVKSVYAAKNEREYFAELSCAYLDKLHYHPHTPEDLKAHDPQGYKLMELVWGPRKKLDTIIKSQAEREAAGRLAAAQRSWNGGKRQAAVEALEKLVRDLPDTKAAATAGPLLEKWREAADKAGPPKAEKP